MIRQDEQRLKVVATVSEVSRMVGLSRARFYQLVGVGVFPPPVYDLRTRRPVYTEEQQRLCLDVRSRNCGVNMQPVIFYSRRFGPAAPATGTGERRRPKPAKPVRPADRHDDIVEYLSGLGLAHVTSEQVAAALRDQYPQGTDGVHRGTVLGRLFVHLHRRNSADSVGR